jgi:hypothetical protein
VPIEVVQIFANTDWPKNVRFTETAGFEVYNALHDSWIKFKAGDWINVTDPKDNYPTDVKVFADTYEAVE